MENIKNFFLSSILTYTGLYCSEVVLSPEIIELLKIIISGIFGLLSTWLIAWIQKKYKVTKSEASDILEKNKENILKKKPN